MNNEEYPKNLFERRKKEFLDRARKKRRQLRYNCFMIVMMAAMILGAIIASNLTLYEDGSFVLFGVHGCIPFMLCSY